MNTVQPLRDLETVSELRRRLSERDPKYCIMFTIGVNTGLRISDLRGLRACDVNGTHISLREQKTGKKKRVLINDQLRVEIDRYMDDKNISGNGLLFPGRISGQPVSRVQAYRVISSAAREIGLAEVGTHTMRKTFGYWHYQRYKDVAILQDIFNHSSPAITLRYIGITDDVKDATLNEFFI